MTFEEYQKLAARTINKDLDKDEQTLHAMWGMVSELGEFFGLYQKMFQGHKINVKHICKELGDLLWFIAEYCTIIGLPFELIAAENIKKLQARYPDGFDPERSLHRKEGDI